MSISLFWMDLKSATKTKSIFVNAKWFICNHTLHLLFLFRLGQSLGQIPIAGKVLIFLIEYFIRVIYASDISCRAIIGPGFVIVHGHDIVIGSDVVIGRNCKVFNGVTLGNKNIAKSSYGEQPHIGNNVVLATGSKILGGITIGDNVIVDANAVVIESCPPNVKMGGVPARIIGDIDEA